MRTRIKDTCDLAGAILAGEHDTDLDFIRQAVDARIKTLFRPGARVRLVGTRNRDLEGVEGRILQVNPKTISVGVGEQVSEDSGRYAYKSWTLGEFNVSPALLELIL